MSTTQCNRFVENAWKRELCSNCFKPREEHSEIGENNFPAGRRILTTTMMTTTTTTMETTTTMNSKIFTGKMNSETIPQGILKRSSSSGSSSNSGKTSSSGRKKAVAFPEVLSSVIGYGGDDFSDSEEFEMSESLGMTEDDVPDGEEERTLSNLTRANTNFNTITANLSSNGSNDSKKSFASLMLGKPRKDSDGKKKTLLVSVTPFGGDNGIPSARRPPSERKACFAGRQSGAVAATNDSKSEVTLKAVNNISEDKISRDRNEKEISNVVVPSSEPTIREDQKISSQSSREKIVDMPLITSSNLIAVIQKSDSLVADDNASNPSTVVENLHEQKSDRKIGITRTPGVKKQKDQLEKPKVNMIGNQGNYKQNLNTKNEYIARGNNGSYQRIEEREIENRELRSSWLGVGRGKDVNTVTIQGAESTADNYGANFGPKVSRELAGEPDGKADEEMVEPPALPRSPPPVESSRISKQQQQQQTAATMTTTIVTTQSEPRNSFLHNVVPDKKKIKPGIPQKPSSLRNIIPPSRGAGQILSTNPRVIGESAESMKSGGGSSKKEEKIAEKNEARNDHRDNNNDKGEEEEENSSQQNDDSLSSESDDNKTVVGEAITECGESVRSPNKRRMAPKPPPPTYAGVQEETGVGSIFARNPGAAILKSDSPVVREKEKRERASSCSPKFRKDVEDETTSDQASSVGGSVATTTPPEPAPRRLISLSQDSLTTTVADKAEEKKKARSRFSLKKFLRMGSKKDQVDGGGIHGATTGSRIEDHNLPTSPHPVGKPRLEIIHPLELDGAAVEVVSREKVARLSNEEQNFKSNTHDTPSGHENNDQSTQRPPSSQSTSPTHHPFARPGKPPPPPRNQSLDDWARLDPANKPARPPPPRTEIKSPSKSWHPPSPTSPTSPDSIYANLAAEDVPGEVRSALAPSKPQRTASMRDQAICQPPVKKRPAAVPPRHEDYEIVNGPRSPAQDSPNMSNDSRHAYECLSSSPECDSSLDLRHGAGAREAAAFQPSGKRKSDSSALDPGIEFKYHHQPFTRSSSLPYCGSETESELYSPYSFYTGDEGPEEDQDWKNKEHELRVGRLRQRRGRSIVHRSLEDNYGAVVVANHEALAQVLEQLNQTSGVPPALRGLKTASLRLSNFALDPSTSLPIGRRIFYSGTWNDAPVTICVALDLALHVTRKEFNLIPIVEFTDTIPEFIAEGMNCVRKDEEGVEATISVLPHLQVCTISSFVGTLKDSGEESFARETSFVLLQLVNAFKNLQARGVEESPKNLSNAILCREDKDACYRLYLLQSLSSDAGSYREQEKASLCQCVLHALRELRLSQKLPLIQELLERERTATLSQVKSVLEFSLWGPADVTLGAPRDREMTLQRWLDLERATVLHALVRARAPLAVTDEYHLLFLVRTSAKIMCEASMLLDTQRRK